MPTITCPDKDTFINFLLGKISGPEQESLEQHFATCEKCAEHADTLAIDDELTAIIKSDLASQIGSTAFANDEESAITKLIQRIKTARQQLETVRIEETLAAPPGDQSASVPTPFAGLSETDISFLAPAQSPDEIGRLGNYRVLEILGMGGMGMVFRAEDPRLKRQVALKTMKPTIAANRDAKVRFLREAQATAALEHDHVVPIYAVDEDRGIPFIAMQYLKGESLRDRLDRQTKLPQQMVIRLGKEIASGLAAAHEQGLIHRDIKPDNIWLDEKSDRAKILDFGLVSATTEDDGFTQSGTVLGTPRYMAPEQALAHPVDHRCDLFSLGSVLYHAASGNTPFIGNNFTATLIAVAHQPPIPLQQAAPELNAEVAAAIMSLLEKDPDKRPQTSGEVADRFAELERTLRVIYAKQISDEKLSDTVSHHHAPLLKAAPPIKPPKSRRLRMAAAGGFAAIILGVIIITITDKDGKETTLRIPTGTDVGIDAQAGSKIAIREEADPSAHSQNSGTVPGLEAFHEARPDVEITVNGQDFSTYKATVKLEAQQTTKITSVAPVVPLDLTPAEPLGTWEMGPEPPWFAQDFRNYSLKDAAVLPGILDRPAIIPGIKRWNVDTVWPRGIPVKIAYSPDGQWIGILDSHLSIYDAKTLKLHRVLPGFAPQYGAWDFAWHPDSQKVTVAADRGAVMRTFNLEGQLLHESNAPGQTSSIAWNKTTKKIARGIYEAARQGSCIEVYDEEFALIQTLPEEAAIGDLGIGQGCLAWSADGESLIALHFDGKVRHWNLEASTAEVIDDWKDRTWQYNSLDWHESGWLAVSNRKEIRIYGPDLKLDQTIPLLALSVRWHPGGRHLLFLDHSWLSVWDRIERKKVVSSEGRSWPGTLVIDWSPDGRELATAGGGSKSLIVIPANFKQPRFQGPSNPTQQVIQLAWSPDGATLASGQRNGPARLWSTDGKAIRAIEEIPTGPAACLAWSTDGEELFATTASKNVWATTLAGNARSLFHSSELYLPGSVVNSPDGKTIIVSLTNGRLQVLGRDGNQIKEIVTGGQSIPFVAWCHASNQIAVCEPDQALKFLEPNNDWNLRIVEDTLIPGIQEPPTWSPDGKRLSINGLGSFDISTKSIKTETFAMAWRPDSQRFITGVNSYLTTVRGNGALMQRRWPQGLFIASAVSWHPRGHLFATATQESRFTVWNESNFQPHWHGVLLPDNKTVTFSAAGDILDGKPEEIDPYLVYYIDRGDGHIETLTPAKFRTLVSSRRVSTVETHNDVIETP